MSPSYDSLPGLSCRNCQPCLQFDYSELGGYFWLWEIDENAVGTWYVHRVVLTDLHNGLRLHVSHAILQPPNLELRETFRSRELFFLADAV
ncbi:hypothetical protein CBS133816_4296 [Aspergillus niger]|nr:hypothetical protein CBS133816_4296 [Aspergillus niger]